MSRKDAMNYLYGGTRGYPNDLTPGSRYQPINGAAYPSPVYNAPPSGFGIGV
jgi:hypothetical protein